MSIVRTTNASHMIEKPIQRATLRCSSSRKESCIAITVLVLRTTGNPIVTCDI